MRIEISSGTRLASDAPVLVPSVFDIHDGLCDRLSYVFGPGGVALIYFAFPSYDKHCRLGCTAFSAGFIRA